ncbi:hypothetical protein BKA56DRAFT_622054 [Ilyonectria sp. MPI-CAGE-AT-0026]|nr:hypothetical protein BKA56DRAFT_622054 [Ilyonectria sp. MPI-CAGE-AT-0026]
MDSLPFSMNGSLQTQIWDDIPCLNHSLLTSQLGFLSCSQRREQAWRAGFNAGFDEGYRKGTDARTQVSGDSFTGVSEIQSVGLGHYSKMEPQDMPLLHWPVLETQHIPPDLAMFIPAGSTAGSFGMSNFGFGGDMSFSDSQKPSLALDAEPISQNSPATSNSINLIPHHSPPYCHMQNRLPLQGIVKMTLGAQTTYTQYEYADFHTLYLSQTPCFSVLRPPELRVPLADPLRLEMPLLRTTTGLRWAPNLHPTTRLSIEHTIQSKLDGENGLTDKDIVEVNQCTPAELSAIKPP